jgi:hypothetical protein
MNLWLLASDTATLVQIFPGGREIHRPIVAAGWPEPAKAIWSVVWHITTAMMLFGGMALAALPLALSAASAVLFVVYGLSRLGSPRILPHWIAFSAIALSGAIGLIP